MNDQRRIFPTRCLRAAKEAGADEAEAYFAEDESFRALASKGRNRRLLP